MFIKFDDYYVNTDKIVVIYKYDFTLYEGYPEEKKMFQIMINTDDEGEYGCSFNTEKERDEALDSLIAEINKGK
jgi:hypothetical protein